MNKQNVKGERLIALFMLSNILFNYPLLALFNQSAMPGGIPLLYLYVFGAWAALIALLAITVEKR
jgi:hypothetical protein